MGMDKAIEHGKEKRKRYRGSKAWDSWCRNHGACDWCRGSRTYRDRREEDAAAKYQEEFMSAARFHYYTKDGKEVNRPGDKELRQDAEKCAKEVGYPPGTYQESDLIDFAEEIIAMERERIQLRIITCPHIDAETAQKVALYVFPKGE